MNKGKQIQVKEILHSGKARANETAEILAEKVDSEDEAGEEITVIHFCVLIGASLLEAPVFWR